MKKTKKMRVCRNGNKREEGYSIIITREAQVVEQVNQFCYLYHSDDETCTVEMKRKIEMVKNALNKRRELFSKRLSKE